MGSFVESTLKGGQVWDKNSSFNQMMNGPQTPEAPDYVGAANATAAGNLAAAKYATVANRATQINPYGTLKWQKGATDFDPWTQTVEFSPEGQRQFDLQNQLQTKYGETANLGFDRVRQTFENPEIDQSKLPAAPINAGMTAQQAIMSRLQPTLESNDEALRTRLANQGISIGSTAYGREQALAGQRANDLYLQAAMQGIGLDTNARKDALNEAYTAQSRPLDLINALRTGSQVQAPQFANYAQQERTSGPNISGAVQNQYSANLDAANAQNAYNQQMMQGLFSIGGAMMSDKRLKTNITKVGKTDGGLDIYTYNYVWGGPTQMGVMAQDVEKVNPEAVIEVAGYKAVNYAKVK